MSIKYFERIERQLQDIRATVLELSTVDEFLTVEETAAFLKISKQTVYRLYREGQLIGYRIGKGKNAPLRFKKSELLSPKKIRKASIL